MPIPIEYQDMHERVKVRETEIKSLITEVLSQEFVSKVLKFSATVSIDESKLVVAGHSMGGATALRVGHSDDRVKCTLTHDPWLTPIHKEIFDN